MSNVRVGSARIDENGKVSGGVPGDQTGMEVAIEPWYLHKQGWVIIRAKDSQIAEKIAADMEMASKNDLIGYDQSTSWDLYDKVRQYGWRSLTAKESGRIGGLMTKKRREMKQNKKG